MNSRNTCILVILAAGLFAFIYFFESRIKAPEPVVEKVLPGFKAGEVTSIQIQPMKQDAIRVERTNGAWQLAKPVVYPAQSIAVDDFLQALEQLSPHTRISAQELKGRHNVEEEYGLDAPQATIVIQQGDDQRILKLGHLTPPGDEVYLQVVGMEGIEVVTADFLNKFVPRQANDWRDTAFVNVKGPAFDRVAVANGAKAFELQRNPVNKLWRMTRPIPARADNPKIEDLLFKLQNLRVNRFETDDPKPDLESLGLQPPELELALDQGTNHFTFQFGKSPTNDESLIYARRNGQNTIVLVSRELLAPWRSDYAEFRDPHLASLSSGLPDRIEVEIAPADKFTVEWQTNGGWRVSGSQCQDFMADGKLMREFVENIARLQVVPFNGQFAVKEVVTKSDLPNYGLAPPALRYILRQSISNATGMTNLVLAELDFSAPRDTNIFACRGDLPEETSVYAVRPADVQKLPVSGLQLRERRVWNFAPADVTLLTLRVNGKSVSLLHKGRFKWDVPPGSIGIFDSIPVESGVEDLAEVLDVEAWVACGDQNRAQYGFTDNCTQISLEVNGAGGPQKLTLDFGGQSPRGLRYAAVKLDGQNWIFEFPARELDKLFSYFNIVENH
jgi:hypothetical protein